MTSGPFLKSELKDAQQGTPEAASVGWCEQLTQPPSPCLLPGCPPEGGWIMGGSEQ